MEEATKYKKYLKALKEATKKKPKVVKPIKRNLGGASMLKNPGKADLDKDGKISSYENKRGMAIEENMKKARKKSMGKMNMGGEMKSTRGYGAARTSGMGLQDESMKPGKVMMANKGGESKGKGLSARGSLLKDKRKRKVEEVLKRMKAPRTINIKKKFTSGTSNPMQRDRKREGYRAKVESAGGKVMFADERGMKKFKNFMGGGMMKPMGYKKGASIMARGCKLGRKKATKLS